MHITVYPEAIREVNLSYKTFIRYLDIIVDGKRIFTIVGKLTEESAIALARFIKEYSRCDEEALEVINNFLIENLYNLNEPSDALYSLGITNTSLYFSIDEELVKLVKYDFYKHKCRNITMTLYVDRRKGITHTFTDRGLIDVCDCIDYLLEVEGISKDDYKYTREMVEVAYINYNSIIVDYNTKTKQIEIKGV